jgi:catechol 2,3-dioxygenase-like lactoylglutathione lyase family enzyme
MSRIQIALNVADIDAAVDFYTVYFGVAPAKRRTGYANFSITEPPLKLVLLETPDTRGEGPAGALNHLGIEVDTADQVAAATARLSEQGLITATEDQVSCCFAVQDKVWSHDPDGAPWEVYTVTGTADIGTRSGTAADPRAGAGPVAGEACCAAPAAATDVADPEIHSVPVRAGKGHG